MESWTLNAQYAGERDGCAKITRISHGTAPPTIRLHVTAGVLALHVPNVIRAMRIIGPRCLRDTHRSWTRSRGGIEAGKHGGPDEGGSALVALFGANTSRDEIKETFTEPREVVNEPWLVC